MTIETINYLSYISSEHIFIFLFFLILVIGATIDKYFLILPDEGMLLLLFLGLLRIYVENLEIGIRLGVVVISFIVYLLVYYVSQQNFGFGDIKWLSVLGLWFPWPSFILMNVLAFTIGSIFVLANLLWKSVPPILPFGPFITISCFITYCWDYEIFLYYEKYFLYSL